MKGYRLILMIVAIAVILMGCEATSDEAAGNEATSSEAVSFYANSIESRTTYDASGGYVWEEGDNVKISATVEGEGSICYVGYVASPRTDATEANFSPVSQEEITYPNGSGTITFRAYYPDSDPDTDNTSGTLIHSIVDQSDLGAIDLMIADPQAVDYSAYNRPSIGFDFKHQLAQISIEVKSLNVDITDFSELTATLNEDAESSNYTFSVEREYNLIDGSNSEVQSSDDTAVINLSCNDNIITALLHPVETYVLLRLYVADRSFDCYFEDTLTAGVTSSYELFLYNETIAILGECKIGDWEDGGTDSSLTPSQKDESDLIDELED